MDNNLKIKNSCHTKLDLVSMYMRSIKHHRTTVMFGKMSQLDNSNFVRTKTAAMFGLDARIALAIFGALSVITGAALFSAIENAQATALLTEMQEVGKAWEAYYLDTGHNLPQESTTSSSNFFYHLKTINLAKNASNIKDWNGPYLKYKPEGYYLKYSDNNNIYMLILTDESTWGGSNTWLSGKCLPGKTCYIWTYIANFSTDYTKKIDSIIDKNDGPTKGNFRWDEFTSDGKILHNYYLKVAPIKNPND